MQYDDRCSDIAFVNLLGPHFRFAQMRPVTLAVCVNISSKKSVISALLYISAT